MTLFNSRIKTLRIVLAPSRPIYEQGVRLGDTQGKYVQFENGRFQTDDKETIERLEKHSTLGVDFWKVSDEPAKPQEPQAPQTPQESQTTQETDLESLTKTQLLEIATERAIEVDAGLPKAEIIERLKTQ